MSWQLNPRVNITKPRVQPSFTSSCTNLVVIPPVNLQPSGLTNCSSCCVVCGVILGSKANYCSGMSSKYQFVRVCAAGWCRARIQEISGGNLHSQHSLYGCRWLCFTLDVKLQKDSVFIYLPSEGGLSETGVKVSALLSSQRESRVTDSTLQTSPDGAAMNHHHSHVCLCL